MGTIIKQRMDRLTTRLVLDYNVSDRIRFSTNFALTYTDNLKNYTYGSSKNNKSTNNSLLAMALTMAPNASIYRYDQYGNNTGEYFLMETDNAYAVHPFQVFFNTILGCITIKPVPPYVRMSFFGRVLETLVLCTSIAAQKCASYHQYFTTIHITLLFILSATYNQQGAPFPCGDWAERGSTF